MASSDEIAKIKQSGLCNTACKLNRRRRREIDRTASIGEACRWKSVQRNPVLVKWSVVLQRWRDGTRDTLLGLRERGEEEEAEEEEEEERKKAFRQRVLGAPAVTSEQQSGIIGTNNNPSHSHSLFSFIA